MTFLRFVITVEHHPRFRGGRPFSENRCPPGQAFLESCSKLETGLRCPPSPMGPAESSAAVDKKSRTPAFAAAGGIDSIAFAGQKAVPRRSGGAVGGFRLDRRNRPNADGDEHDGGENELVDGAHVIPPH